MINKLLTDLLFSLEVATHAHKEIFSKTRIAKTRVEAKECGDVKISRTESDQSIDFV